MLLNEKKKAIEENMKSYELEIDNKLYEINPVNDLCGHQIKQYKIHAGKVIPNIYVKEYNERVKEDEFYAVETQHVSESTFDLSKFVKLVELPIEGGAVAKLRKQFSTDISTVAYGTTYETVQEIVDVILGYGEYLKSKGFKFTRL